MREGEFVDIAFDSGAEVSCLPANIGVKDTGKAALSTQDLSLCGWETVFPADGGSLTLVKKRCAWYLRAKLKPHSELPFKEGEEFLEVMSMHQGAGVVPVEAGGSSSSSGPEVPEDVEKSVPLKKLVAPTAAEREEHTAIGHAVFRTWCHECCIGRVECINIVQQEEKPRFPQLPLTTGT